MWFNILLAIVLTLYFTTYLSWPDWLYLYIFFSFEYFDSFYHYAACWVPLNLKNKTAAPLRKYPSLAPVLFRYFRVFDLF